MVSDISHFLDAQKAVGLDGIHTSVLRELVEVLTEPLSTKYQQSWLTGEVPVDCRSANVMSISKKCCKEDLGNHRPFSLNSCQEWSWSSSSWVQPHSTSRTIGRSGPASKDLEKPGSAWAIWAPSVTEWTLSKWGKSCGVVYIDFSSLWHHFPHHFPGKTGCHGLDGCPPGWV